MASSTQVLSLRPPPCLYFLEKMWDKLHGLQVVEVIRQDARDKRLQELLHKYHGSRKNRVLVFVLYKKEATRVEAQLSRAGWKATSFGLSCSLFSVLFHIGAACVLVTCIMTSFACLL